jgi:hypothetical protein
VKAGDKVTWDDILYTKPRKGIVLEVQGERARVSITGAHSTKWLKIEKLRLQE